jgi:hypothetical protein
MDFLATFDQHGLPTGFYEVERSHLAPTGAVPISEAQWREFLDNPGRRRWNAQAQTVELYEPPPPPLDELKARAIDQIDVAAGSARAAWVSKGAHLDAEYLRAVEQAEAYQADPDGSYPALQADIDAGTQDPRLGRTVQTLAEAADLILYTRGVWMAALDQIRATRLSAKAAVRAATTAEDIEAIVASLSWPTPSTNSGSTS